MTGQGRTCQHQQRLYTRHSTTHSLRPIRSSRRAVNGHQYRETMADQITPTMTLVERWKAIWITVRSRSR